MADMLGMDIIMEEPGIKLEPDEPLCKVTSLENVPLDGIKEEPMDQEYGSYDSSRMESLFNVLHHGDGEPLHANSETNNIQQVHKRCGVIKTEFPDMIKTEDGQTMRTVVKFNGNTVEYNETYNEMECSSTAAQERSTEIEIVPKSEPGLDFPKVKDGGSLLSIEHTPFSVSQSLQCESAVSSDIQHENLDVIKQEVLGEVITKQEMDVDVETVDKQEEEHVTAPQAPRKKGHYAFQECGRPNCLGCNTEQPQHLSRKKKKYQRKYPYKWVPKKYQSKMAKHQSKNAKYQSKSAKKNPSWKYKLKYRLTKEQKYQQKLKANFTQAQGQFKVSIVSKEYFDSRQTQLLDENHVLSMKQFYRKRKNLQEQKLPGKPKYKKSKSGHYDPLACQVVLRDIFNPNQTADTFTTVNVPKSKNPFKCLWCNHSSPIWKVCEFYKHLCEAHRLDSISSGALYPCPQCTILFTSQQDLNRHLLLIQHSNHLPRKTSLCHQLTADGKFCYARFVHNYLLLRHEADCHEIFYTHSFYCTQCPALFNSKRFSKEFRQHVKAHRKVFSCPACDYVRVGPSPLQVLYHVTKHIPPDTDRIQKCEYCQGIFFTKANFDSHKGSDACIPQAQRPKVQKPQKVRSTLCSHRHNTFLF